MIIVQLEARNIRKFSMQLRNYGEKAFLESVSKRAKYEFLLGKVVEKGYVGTFSKEIVWEGSSIAWETNYKIVTTKPEGEVRVTSTTAVVCQLSE